MSILELLKGDGKSGFGYDSTTTDVTAGLDLAGRTILVTGCNSGLGQETLSALCGRGARVIGAARTLEKATAACGRVSGETFPVAGDLSEPVSVRTAVASVNLKRAWLMIALSRRISASSCSEHQLYFLWRRVVGENAEAFDFLDAFEHDGVVQRLNRWPA